MQLKDLEQYDPVTIQCHDNPDGDALAAGFGLYSYFKERGRQTRLVYGGHNRIHKANLKLMVEQLQIPVEYISAPYERQKGLLITVDSQYGAGNIVRIPADHVAIIDHHQVEIEGVELSRIEPGLGSCCTLVWEMLREAGYDINRDKRLGTALYYGLYTDTGQFAELQNPRDMDMRDSLDYQKSLITTLRNSNISLKELEIAGIAMIRCIFNDDYQYAIIHAQPCDPNVLGLISDFLIQVDEIKSCVVYNESPQNFKLSVRSCVREVKASELAEFLCGDIGSGGGRLEKAGGTISKRRYEAHYPTLHTEAYVSQKMNEYFDYCDMIYSRDYQADVKEMQLYRRKKVRAGFVCMTDMVSPDTPVTIRTLQGDLHLTAEKNQYILIGEKGAVQLMDAAEFQETYRILDQAFDREGSAAEGGYQPTVKNRQNGEVWELAEYAGLCEETGEALIYARRLDRRVKVFPKWDEETYLLGREGDYLAVRQDDQQDVFVIDGEQFRRGYQEEAG